jgi:hypothetical protein
VEQQERGAAHDSAVWPANVPNGGFWTSKPKP